MFGDSVFSYMLLVVLGMIIFSFVAQYLVNRMHEPYMEETEDGFIVYLYEASRRGGRYVGYTFTDKDGHYAYVPKTTRILLYVGGVILAAVMMSHSFSQKGIPIGETVKLILLFGVMMLGVSIQRPIMAYMVLRKEY